MTRAEAERQRDRLTAAGVHAVLIEAGPLGEWDVVRIRVPGLATERSPSRATVAPPPLSPYPEPLGQDARRLGFFGGSA